MSDDNTKPLRVPREALHAPRASSGQSLAMGCAAKGRNGESKEMSEPIEVILLHHLKGDQGAGYYLYESECLDEGYIAFFGETKPTADALKAICSDYVEV